MNKEKRNIKPHADKEVKHLMVLLDKSQASAFKKMVPELQDTWVKKQMFRTETEMRFSVLSDNKYGTNAAKYWQSVREQNTHFENLMHLSFDYRKNDVEIKKIHREIKKEKDPLEKELKQIELERKLYGRAGMELQAKARMREISTWSKLKKEYHDGKFDDQDVNTHQAESYMHQLEQKKLTLTAGSSQPEVFNVLGQLETLKRVRKSGELLSEKERKLLSKKK
jgi:hypothetical protein